MADDSLSSFPRAWRKADAAPNAAVLPEEDVTKAAPTTKKLGLYPSGKHVVVSYLEVGLVLAIFLLSFVCRIKTATAPCGLDSQRVFACGPLCPIEAACHTPGAQPWALVIAALWADTPCCCSDALLKPSLAII